MMVGVVGRLRDGQGPELSSNDLFAITLKGDYEAVSGHKDPNAVFGTL